MERTLLTLTEQQWRSIEEKSRRLPVGHAILDFWREALGLTVEEWDALDRGAFNVTDYEVTQADNDRLTTILSIKAKARHDKAKVAWILLDKGPAVATSSEGITPL